MYRDTIVLCPNSKARYRSETVVEIFLPNNTEKQSYTIMAKDPTQCPPNSPQFSCILVEWVEAINYVCRKLTKKA